MKTNWIPCGVLALLLSSLLASYPASAQDGGLQGPPEGARPVFAHPDRAPQLPAPRATFQAPLGFEVSAQHHEDLKHLGPRPFPTGGQQISYDPNTTAPAGGTGFNGPTPN